MKNDPHASTVFGRHYADHYDLFYHDKDYEAECDMIEDVFRRYGKKSVKSILDLGCGTGNHAIPLSRRGYQVTGVDRSSEMLARARSKTSALIAHDDKICQAPIFLEGDVRTIDIEQRFDAILMMFAVLGYQRSNDDVLAALQTVRRHLNPGGLFVCDVWYGPAVLAIRPGERVKVIPTEEGQVIRVAAGSLDLSRHLSEVRYHIWHISNKRVACETTETHQMRFFFPQELAFFMGQAELEMTAMTAFGDLSSLPSESTWNALVTAKAV